LAPARERVLRRHLAACSSCRDHYDDVLSITRLDPRTPTLEERLARGLGLSSAGHSTRWRVVALPGLAVAAAAAGWLFFWAGPGADPAAGFAARGPTLGRAGESEFGALPLLVTYAVRAGEGPKAVSAATAATAATSAQTGQGTIDARDELAFAYRNPTGKKYLMVFAIDEHAHVYWYHPGWPDPAANPSAVGISTAPGLHELPAAISQTYDGEHLMLHALFTDRALTVREVEEQLEAAPTMGDSSRLPEPLRAGVHVTRELRIKGTR
jgi:hypothetical protein